MTAPTSTSPRSPPVSPRRAPPVVSSQGMVGPSGAAPGPAPVVPSMPGMVPAAPNVLSVVPGAPGLPSGVSPGLPPAVSPARPMVTSTPPRRMDYGPTTPQSDLRPPERPFARGTRTGSPGTHSAAGYTSQASQIDSDSSMVDMHLGLDSGRRDVSGRLDAPMQDTPDSAPIAAFESESDHDEGRYDDKHRRQSFKGFFRKMVTGKPPPLPVSPNQDVRRHRKTRSSVTDVTESPDTSWAENDEGQRPHFWRKLGKSPKSAASHTRRFPSSQMPPLPTDAEAVSRARERSTSAYARPQRPQYEPPPPGSNWLLDSMRDG